MSILPLFSPMHYFDSPESITKSKFFWVSNGNNGKKMQQTRPQIWNFQVYLEWVYSLLWKIITTAKIIFSTRRLLVQSQEWKHQKDMWNLFKANNKDTRTTSMTLVSCPHLLALNRFHTLFYSFYGWLWTNDFRFGSHNVSL